jgi:phytoene synthase
MTPADAQSYCERITTQSGSNFYYSFLFLSPARRDAMYTIYAFCREIDGVVDDPPPGSNPRQQLERWRRELEAAYHGAPTNPVAISLAEHNRRLRIPQQLFEELIAGVEMDLVMTRYATFEDLYRYCYRVASVVGLICLYVFGAEHEEARKYAVNLGLAFQLTNILRDLRADADRGRIYLPQDDLHRFGYRESDLFKHAYTDAFVALMRFESARARDYYGKARESFLRLPPSDRRALVVAEIMQNVYRRILDRIDASNYRVFGARIGLRPVHRLAVAVGTWAHSQLSAIRHR